MRLFIYKNKGKDYSLNSNGTTELNLILLEKIINNFITSIKDNSLIISIKQ